jgi:hypothetical protein
MAKLYAAAAAVQPHRRQCVARAVDRAPARGDLSTMSWPRLSIVLALRAFRSPATADALLRVAWRFRRRGWWHRFPFLPLPARDYLRWRMYTAYGDADAVPPAEDIIRFARWATSEP